MRQWDVIGGLVFPGLPLLLGVLLAGLVGGPTLWESEVVNLWGAPATRPGMVGEVVTLEGGVTRRTMRFASHQDTCEAWLYLPPGLADAARPPVVVMAPGFGSEKSHGLEAYASACAQGGVAAFVFEFRNWGGSSGQPRQLVEPVMQVQDYESAIAHIQESEDMSRLVDTSRIALWGVSTSGGHALMAAARSPESILAVVAMTPYLDSAPLYDAIFQGRGYLFAARYLTVALGDIIRMSIGMVHPLYVPLVGPPGSLATFALEPDELAAHPSNSPLPAGDDSSLGVCRNLAAKCEEWAADGLCEGNKFYMVGYDGYMGRCRLACDVCPAPGSEEAEKRHPGAWRNLVPSRFALPTRAYRPSAYLDQISCPVLLIAATHDTFSPAPMVRAAAVTLPAAQLLEWDMKHYAAFRHGSSQEGVAVLVQFLRKHLGVADEPEVPQAVPEGVSSGGEEWAAEPQGVPVPETVSSGEEEWAEEVHVVAGGVSAGGVDRAAGQAPDEAVAADDGGVVEGVSAGGEDWAAGGASEEVEAEVVAPVGQGMKEEL